MGEADEGVDERREEKRKEKDEELRRGHRERRVHREEKTGRKEGRRRANVRAHPSHKARRMGHPQVQVWGGVREETQDPHAKAACGAPGHCGEGLRS